MLQSIADYIQCSGLNAPHVIISAGK